MDEDEKRSRTRCQRDRFAFLTEIRFTYFAFAVRSSDKIPFVFAR